MWPVLVTWPELTRIIFFRSLVPNWCVVEARKFQPESYKCLTIVLHKKTLRQASHPPPPPWVIVSISCKTPSLKPHMYHNVFVRENYVYGRWKLLNILINNLCIFDSFELQTFAKVWHFFPNSSSLNYKHNFLVAHRDGDLQYQACSSCSSFYFPMPGMAAVW